MSKNNEKVLNDWKLRYPEAFQGRILELGSQVVAGTVRPWFPQDDYIGVDHEVGEGVDIVAEAKDIDFPEESFNTIISFSMLEHDLEWKKSLAQSIPLLKKDGYFMLHWGAEGNLPHMDVFKEVPHQEVLAFLMKHGLWIMEAFWDKNIYGFDGVEGGYTVLAKKCE